MFSLLLYLATLEAGMYDGWWSNDPYAREAPNSEAVSVPEEGLKNGGIWLFDLAKDPNERKNVGPMTLYSA